MTYFPKLFFFWQNSLNLYLSFYQFVLFFCFNFGHLFILLVFQMLFEQRNMTVKFQCSTKINQTQQQNGCCCIYLFLFLVIFCETDLFCQKSHKIKNLCTSLFFCLFLLMQHVPLARKKLGFGKLCM